MIKTHKIEIYGEIANAVFTLNKIFSQKGNKNKDLSTYFFILKMGYVNMLGCWDYKDPFIWKLGNNWNFYYWLIYLKCL